MLPFNESCFRVLHFNYGKKKNQTQISLYTASLISFCIPCLLSTGEQKGIDFKEQPNESGTIFLLIPMQHCDTLHCYCDQEVVQNQKKKKNQFKTATRL